MPNKSSLFLAPLLRMSAIARSSLVGQFHFAVLSGAKIHFQGGEQIRERHNIQFPWPEHVSQHLSRITSARISAHHTHPFSLPRSRAHTHIIAAVGLRCGRGTLPTKDTHSLFPGKLAARSPREWEMKSGWRKSAHKLEFQWKLGSRCGFLCTICVLLYTVFIIWTPFPACKLLACRGSFYSCEVVTLFVICRDNISIKLIIFFVISYANEQTVWVPLLIFVVSVCV
jgi:hypothetical protein